MDFKKQLATPEERIKLLQQLIKDGESLPPDKQILKILEFLRALVKGFVAPSVPKKGTFVSLIMQTPEEKKATTNILQDIINEVTKGTATDKESILSDNLKENDKDKN